MGSMLRVMARGCQAAALNVGMEKTLQGMPLADDSKAAGHRVTARNGTGRWNPTELGVCDVTMTPMVTTRAEFCAPHETNSWTPWSGVSRSTRLKGGAFV